MTSTTKNDILFELIKSLGKSEKRYFKIYASRNQSKGNKYHKLFEAIDKQKVYNEKHMLLSKQLGKEVTANFRFNKHYLYNLILRSLNSYHSEASTNVKLKNTLLSIEVLYEKGLFVQCEKLISKGKKIARQFDNHICLMDFLKWETELMRAKSNQGITNQEIKNVYKQVFTAIEYHKNTNEYSRLSALTGVTAQKKGVVRSTKELKIAKELDTSELMNYLLLKKEDKTLTYSAKMYFYLCCYHQLSQSNDYKTARTYLEKQIELMESNQHFIFENPIQYISALNNLIICHKHLSNNGLIFPLITKFKNITAEYKVKTERIKNVIFYRASNLELDEYIRTGEFEKGLPLIKVIDTEMKNSHIKIINKEREVVIYYNIAYIYFGAGNFNMANQFLNKIINDEKTDLRADIYSFARIMQMVAHYEMGNDLLLEYMVKSIYRFLYRKNRLYKFETAILDFIKTKTPYMNTKKETINAFIILK